jgi:predicted MFS family arabinose efflux permease
VAAAAEPRASLSPALRLALAPLVALGFSRFAYALLLPAMRADFGWTYAQAGTLNTANALGYLAGALAAASLARQLGTARAFAWSIWVSAAALLATAAPSHLALLLAVRALGGVATAVAFVLGSVLAVRSVPHRPAMALAIYFAGSGAGMVLAGALIPLAAGELVQVPWRAAWLAMGATSLAAAALAGRGLPRDAAAPRAGWGSLHDVASALGPTLWANVLYGAGYVGYMTFVMALMHGRRFAAGEVALVFVLLGGASMMSSLLWGRVLARLAGGRGFALVSAVVLAGSLPMLASASKAAAFASALVFGAGFMAGPAAVSLVAQRKLQGAALASGLALLTAAFSVGQSVGPLVAGALSDAAGSLDAGLWLGPVLLALGAAVSLRQR